MTDHTPRTVVVTGSASGMGAATCRRLAAAGDRVIGVDRHDADVVADLATPDGRARAVEGVVARSGGAIDALVTWAGVAGLTDLPGSTLVSVNYFGTVALLDGLRPLLAAGRRSAAIAIASNSITVQPGMPMGLVAACLEGDEARARALADEATSLMSYPASKLAVTRWCRGRAPTEQWAGAGISLNVLAPGAVETPMLEATRRDPTVGGFVEAFPLPVGRKGEPDELAGVVQFLMGPDARFLCGSVLFVDGGTDALLRPDDHPTPWQPLE